MELGQLIHHKAARETTTTTQVLQFVCCGRVLNEDNHDGRLAYESDDGDGGEYDDSLMAEASDYFGSARLGCSITEAK